MTGNKISVYIKNDDLFRDMKLLTNFDSITITELVNNLLSEFVKGRNEDLEFLRKQADERESRRNNNQ